MTAAPIPLLPALPLGDGPKRAHVKMRRGLSQIARRVAMAALANNTDDVLRDVYTAGIAHGVAIMEQGQ